MTERPIACTLTPGELRSGRSDLLPGLAMLADRLAPLPNGVRLVFAPTAATLRRIGEVIARERRCCRFLDFRVHTGGVPGALRLDVTGPAGTREFLSDLFEGAVPAAG